MLRRQPSQAPCDSSSHRSYGRALMSFNAISMSDWCASCEVFLCGFLPPFISRGPFIAHLLHLFLPIVQELAPRLIWESQLTFNDSQFLSNSLQVSLNVLYWRCRKFLSADFWEIRHCHWVDLPCSNSVIFLIVSTQYLLSSLKHSCLSRKCPLLWRERYQ